jgi:phosphate transport system protein
MKKRIQNNTLKSVLDIILYENPETQGEIAEKLGITRRYVTKLLQPLVKQKVVRRAYILDLKKFDEFSEIYDEEKTSREYAGTYLIKNMLKDMANHVCKQFSLSFKALSNHDPDLSNEALKMDYTTNKMHEKVRSSVDTVISINPYSEFSKTMAFSEIAYDLERIGDYTCHIANFSSKESEKIEHDLLFYFSEMFKISKKMIKNSMKAFLNEQIELRDELLVNEERIHDLQKKALNNIATHMADDEIMDKERSNYYLSLSRVVKAFERIGDISLDIINISREFYLNIPRTTTPELFRRKKKI